MGHAQTDELLIQQARERLAAATDRLRGDLPPSLWTINELRTQIGYPRIRDARGDILVGEIRKEPINTPISIHYEQRMVLRDDLADVPPLGNFERQRLIDRVLAMIDTQTVEGFLGGTVPKCACGSALIQGAQFCIDCGVEVRQPAASSAPAFAVTGLTQRLGE